jgi:hypothetical protein
MPNFTVTLIDYDFTKIVTADAVGYNQISVSVRITYGGNTFKRTIVYRKEKDQNLFGTSANLVGLAGMLQNEVNDLDNFQQLVTALQGKKGQDITNILFPPETP